MIRFISRRLVVSTITAFGLSIILFVLLHIAPGSPVDMMFNPLQFRGDRSAAVAHARAELGLDKPLPVQYVSWLGQLVRGNLGVSYSTHRPVTDMLLGRIGATAYLMVVAMTVSILLGVALGIVSALRRNTWVDYGTAVVSLTAHSIPNFFLALLAIYVVGVKLGWLPTAGMNTPGGGAVGSLRHLVLPAVVLGFGLAPGYIRFTRANLLEVLSQEYLVTARAKGVPQRSIILRHAFRNALIPLVSVTAVTIPKLFAGSVVIEEIFAWPGMGQLALDAITKRDYPVLMGFIMLIGVFILIGNMLADVSYALIDPRVRIARGRA